MLKISHMALLVIGTICLVVANKQEDQLSELLEREERLEKVVEKLTDLIGDTAPKTAPKTDAPKTDAPKTNALNTDAPKNDASISDASKTDASKSGEKAVRSDVDNPEEDQDERIAELVDLERRLEGSLHQLDIEEDVNDVAGADHMRQLEMRPKNSPWWGGGRRRRRIFRAIGRFVRRTVSTAISVVRRVVRGVQRIYGQYRFYSECIRNAAALAAAAGDEEEFQRLSVQADEAERMEADQRIKKDMEEKKTAGVHGNLKDVAKDDKVTTLLRERRSVAEDEADISLDEIENEDEDEIDAKLVDKEEKSDAKPWGRRRRRRRRRRTAHKVVKNVCKYVNAYSKYVLMAIQVAG